MRHLSVNVGRMVHMGNTSILSFEEDAFKTSAFSRTKKMTVSLPVQTFVDIYLPPWGSLCSTYKNSRLGPLAAHLVERAYHVLRLSPYCSSPGLSPARDLCSMSFPLSSPFLSFQPKKKKKKTNWRFLYNHKSQKKERKRKRKSWDAM